VRRGIGSPAWSSRTAALSSTRASRRVTLDLSPTPAKTWRACEKSFLAKTFLKDGLGSEDRVGASAIQPSSRDERFWRQVDQTRLGFRRAYPEGGSLRRG
jgi:hypothetical protein